jgi:hypothetical protein
MEIEKLKKIIFKSPKFQTRILEDLRYGTQTFLEMEEEKSLKQDRIKDLFYEYLEELRVFEMGPQELLVLAFEHGYIKENKPEVKDRNREVQATAEAR